VRQIEENNKIVFLSLKRESFEKLKFVLFSGWRSTWGEGVKGNLER